MQIIKVYDSGCPVCTEMGRFDKEAITAVASDVRYKERALPLIMSQESPEDVIIYQILERYAVNPDYTLDLPVYVVSDNPTKYKGHIQGEKTQGEFTDELLTILSNKE